MAAEVLSDNLSKMNWIILAGTSFDIGLEVSSTCGVQLSKYKYNLVGSDSLAQLLHLVPCSYCSAIMPVRRRFTVSQHHCAP
jgi:hypothetical protein